MSVMSRHSMLTAATLALVLALPAHAVEHHAAPASPSPAAWLESIGLGLSGWATEGLRRLTGQPTHPPARISDPGANGQCNGYRDPDGTCVVQVHAILPGTPATTK